MIIRRTRTIKKQFWFNDEEQSALSKLSEKVGKSESYVIRNLVLDCKLKEKPDNRFYDLMKTMINTSNNLNQIATKAHTLGFIDELAYKREVDKLDNFIEEVKDKFLRNGNIGDKK